MISVTGEAQYHKAFLSSFPAAMRGQVANLFHFAVRGGVDAPEAVVETVAAECRRRLQEAEKRGQFDELLKWTIAVDVLAAKRAEAVRYAEAVIAWEKLPYGERAKIKQQRALQHSLPYWAHKPPTEKQLNTLIRLGYQGPVINRLHAAALINQLKQQGGGKE